MRRILLILLLSTVHVAGVSKAIGKGCKDYGVQFERVFTVPGEAAGLNCSLASPDVFDFRNVPYTISWYEERSGRELSGEEWRVHVNGTMLWLLRSSLEDAGRYVCVLRTANACFQQTTIVIVDVSPAGDCSRPHKASQWLTVIANGYLACPLLLYLNQLEDPKIEWFKECEYIAENEKFGYVDNNKLLIRHVLPSDAGNYTCSLTFRVNGTAFYLSETIVCEIKEKWIQQPRMIEPVDDTVKVDHGSPFNKTCRVFVPGTGGGMVDVFWATGMEFVSFDSSDRVHQIPLSKTPVEDGEWLEVLLIFTVVKEEDFKNYRCMVFSDRNGVSRNFTLALSDPNLLIPFSFVFASLASIFFMAVVTYRNFKIDIVLWCRSTFPSFYKDPGCDGKTYDAYVVYSRTCGDTSSRAVETFALHSLPQVLERKCGYKLFIFGRDSLPGEAILDSVQRNICSSRRLLLLYTASTFSQPEATLLIEQQMALHGALVEDSAKVVLVEMEQVTDVSRLPPSVRHLLRKQGAVRCWKRGGGLLEQVSLSPSSGPWKLLRYHMPARGGAPLCPEKKNLLRL